MPIFKLTGYQEAGNFSNGSNGQSLFQEINFAAPVNTNNTFTWLGGGASTRFRVDEAVGGSPDTTLEEVGNDQTLDEGVTVAGGLSFAAGDDITTGWRLEVRDDAFNFYFLSSVGFGSTGSGNNPVHLLVWHEKNEPPPGTTLTVINRVNGVAPNGIPYVCFTRGVEITTVRGPVRVEHLWPGDLVVTADNGLQPIRWIGRRAHSPLQVQLMRSLQPILIKAGAFGVQQDLWVSPQHRMLIKGQDAQLAFGEPEVFVAAQHLVDDRRVLRAVPPGGLEYIHFACDQHEVVFANGAPAETLHLGPGSLGTLDAGALAELRCLGMLDDATRRMPSCARPILRGIEGRFLQRRLRAAGR
ncbi:MAG: Hint domain-containing protein [Pseudomonadota bacterium]